MTSLVYDAWLSEQLTLASYKWQPAPNYEVSPNAFDALHNIEEDNFFIYTKLPTIAHRYRIALEKEGFYLADTSVIFEKKRTESPLKGNCKVRWATPEDQSGAVRIAQQDFIYDRFHADPNIPKETANRLKAEWVANFFRGKRGDQMVIALVDDKVVGFNQLLFRDNTLVIDLIATSSDHRRQGIAHDLMAFAENNAENYETVRVGTQASNIPSIRLYESFGFRVIESGYVLHHCQIDTL